MIIYVILIIFITLILYNLKRIEFFDLVGYNSTKIPNTKIKTVYDNENDLLNNFFDTISTDNLDTNNYELLNKNINFPYNDIFKMQLLDYFKNNNNFPWSKEKIDIFSISEIYKNGNSYIFTINLLNKTKFSNRAIKTKITFDGKNIVINGFKLLNSEEFKLTPYPEYVKCKTCSDEYNIFSITNALHLSRPFDTDEKIMYISQDMKNKFKSILDKKSGDLNKLIRDPAYTIV